MTAPLNPEDIETLARKRAGAKMGWYTHAMVFVLVNLYWYLSAEQGWGWGHHGWSYKAPLGWGLGLALHGVSVFILGRGSSLRERMVQKERERLMRERNPGQ